MLRLVVATPVLASAVAAGLAAPATTDGSSRQAIRQAAATYVSPIAGQLRVVRPFDPSSTPYGPGHRGVDLRAERNAVVRSAGPGSVSFAGLVAGRGVVVVSHA
ncbi:MAG TPA: hypothetical protein VKB75_15215, partial [Jatrophihabitans sp.]|nr:hypothetical protein [Jatrophihabitans sp.]